ncbi:hypothetical protein [Candidatus Galacturonibacter soehngenii]|uniref:ABC transporter permease n=1 Tax=Candidatus Galacturonatibacter soehngenii TaxID=2307010 RepID=A0A7V7QNM1_9FIRM|nr:hypothetical protein [Candidatus Galacturonibacter soehngenii]KAB1440584.1 hypothetical protein F7O84_01775 [Candidatus Galacturonibacter soehngenii]
MLSKLIKHEFNATSKTLGILHIALFITTIMGIIAINLSKNDNYEYISSLTLIIYVLILIAVAVAVLIYLVVRFYRNLFTDEGYLMNTLPVKPSYLIFSKLIVSFVWSIINFVCTIFSILLLVLSQTSIASFFDTWNEITKYAWNEIGVSISSLLFLGILGGLVSIIYMFLMFYTSIAIGQTMRTHKVLFSMGAYVVLYIISQIISTMGLMPFGFFALLQTDNLNIETIFTPLMLSSYAISIALIVLYFFITNYIISKKLNLE